VMRSFQLAGAPSTTAATFNIVTTAATRAGPVTHIQSAGRWFNA
jgi:hypothetical protein